MKIKIVLMFYILLCSCLEQNNTPTDRVFEVSLEIDEVSLTNNGYKKNPDGFPLFAKTLNDTTFLYVFKDNGKINYKESSFKVEKDFLVKDFLQKNQCSLIDTVHSNNKEYYLINRDNNYKFYFRFDSTRNRVFVKYIYP